MGQNHGLKSPRRRIFGASEVSTIEPAQRLPESFGRPKRCALENAGFKRVILTILGCVLGVLGLILDPGGSLKQPQHVKKSKNNADQKDVHWKMLV